MKSTVVVKTCTTYELDKLQRVLSESLTLLGGASRFFKRNNKVLVKPNLLTDAYPEKGITTHPHFVQAVVRVFKDNGLRVAIADIPAEHRLEANVEKVYRNSGMRQIAEEENVELLTESKFIEEDGVIYSSWIKEFDHLVSLPKFKTHDLMTLTGAVKNLFGLTPRLYRVSLHKRYIRPENFAQMLLDVYMKCKPTLSFVDGIVAMEGDGPAYSGTLRSLGLVATSNDALALDSILACIMGLKPQDIFTNREGAYRQLGKIDLEEIEIKGERLEDFFIDDFKLPTTYFASRLPKTLLKFLVERFGKSRPKVNKIDCNGCTICIENCPLIAIKIENKKAKIDYQKCVDCFCCLEVCPQGAMKIKSGPLIHVLKIRQRLKDFAKKVKLEGIIP